MVPCFFWFAVRIGLTCFPARLGLWFHLKQHLIPTTPAKTLLKVQTSSTRSVKIHFSISTNRNKRDGKKTSYTGIKHYDNFEYWGVLFHPYRVSGCTYCFFIRFLQYLQKHYCLVDSIQVIRMMLWQLKCQSYFFIYQKAFF